MGSVNKRAASDGADEASFQREFKTTSRAEANDVCESCVNSAVDLKSAGGEEAERPEITPDSADGGERFASHAMRLMAADGDEIVLVFFFSKITCSFSLCNITERNTVKF